MALTVNEIYQKSKIWMFEKPSSTTYNNYIIEITNKILAELYDENNMMRMFEGKVPFIDGVAAHQVSELTDTIDYEDEYVLDVIPKGIDANFSIDDDLNKMQIYQTEYNNARVEKQKCVSKEKIEELTKRAQNAD